MTIVSLIGHNRSCLRREVCAFVHHWSVVGVLKKVSRIDVCAVIVEHNLLGGLKAVFLINIIINEKILLYIAL